MSRSQARSLPGERRVDAERGARGDDRTRDDRIALALLREAGRVEPRRDLRLAARDDAVDRDRLARLDHDLLAGQHQRRVDDGRVIAAHDARRHREGRGRSPANLDDIATRAREQHVDGERGRRGEPAEASMRFRMRISAGRGHRRDDGRREGRRHDRPRSHSPERCGDLFLAARPRAARRASARGRSRSRAERGGAEEHLRRVRQSRSPPRALPRAPPRPARRRRDARRASFAANGQAPPGAGDASPCGDLSVWGGLLARRRG